MLYKLSLVFFVTISSSCFSQCRFSRQEARVLQQIKEINYMVLSGMSSMGDKDTPIDELQAQSRGICDGFFVEQNKKQNNVFNDLIPTKQAKGQIDKVTLETYLIGLIQRVATTTFDKPDTWQYIFNKKNGNIESIDIVLNKAVKYNTTEHGKDEQSNLLSFRYIIDTETKQNKTWKLAGIDKLKVLPSNAIKKVTDTELEDCLGVGRNLESACETLVGTLNAKYEHLIKNKSISFSKFTFENRGITNELSDKINEYIQKYMGLASAPSTEAAGGKEKVYISGKFTEMVSDRLGIAISVGDSPNKKKVTLWNYDLPMKWLNENNFAVVPSNYQQYKETQTIVNNNALSNTYKDLSLALRTDKGRIGVEYRDKETMSIYYKVNQPCYLRLLYHFQDGRDVLLLDNFEVNSTNVGREVKLPQLFECTPPFGQEYLICFAADRPFDKIDFIISDGYKFIQNKLENTLIVTRAFKQESKIVEDKIQIVTRGK